VQFKIKNRVFAGSVGGTLMQFVNIAAAIDKLGRWQNFFTHTRVKPF